MYLLSPNFPGQKSGHAFSVSTVGLTESSGNVRRAAFSFGVQDFPPGSQVVGRIQFLTTVETEILDFH